MNTKLEKLFLFLLLLPSNTAVWLLVFSGDYLIAVLLFLAPWAGMVSALTKINSERVVKGGCK